MVTVATSAVQVVVEYGCVDIYDPIPGRGAVEIATAPRLLFRSAVWLAFTSVPTLALQST